MRFGEAIFGDDDSLSNLDGASNEHANNGLLALDSDFGLEPKVLRPVFICILNLVVILVVINVSIAALIVFIVL